MTVLSMTVELKGTVLSIWLKLHYMYKKALEWNSQVPHFSLVISCTYMYVQVLIHHHLHATVYHALDICVINSLPSRPPLYMLIFMFCPLTHMFLHVSSWVSMSTGGSHVQLLSCSNVHTHMLPSCFSPLPAVTSVIWSSCCSSSSSSH